MAERDLKTNELLLISYRPLNDEDTKRLAAVSLVARPQAKFDNGDDWWDVHYIYRITKSG